MVSYLRCPSLLVSHDTQKSRGSLDSIHSVCSCAPVNSPKTISSGLIYESICITPLVLMSERYLFLDSGEPGLIVNNIGSFK